MKESSLSRFKFALLLIIVSCSQAPQDSKWVEGMQGMTRSLEDLLPYIYSRSRYADSKNKKYIQTKLMEMNYASSSLSRHVARGISGDDPLMRVSLENLKANIDRSLESFLVDNHEYSQQLLKASVSFCVSCHTRTETGRSFVVYENFGRPGSGLENVDPMELAQAQIAMRQFQAARSELLGLLAESKGNREVHEKALQVLLSLHVRSLNSLDQAVQDLKSVDRRSLKSLPLSLWEKDLAAMQKKPVRYQPSQIFQGMSQKPVSQETFVRDLAYSRDLHNALNATETPRERAQILFSLGEIYKTHPSLSSWDLPEQYYEACILSHPHSDEARRCYFAFEQTLRKVYKLSPQLPLPDHEKNQLDRLRALSNPLKSGDDRSTGTSSPDRW